MSPAPARTSRDAILAAAREILEADGLDAVTMTRVGDRVGVRGPSLYKHVPNRAALIRAVADAVTADLGRTLAGRPTDDAKADLRALATRYRRFVRANPERLRTAVRAPAARLPAGPGCGRGGRAADRGSDGSPGREAGALAAARTVAAWAHGFVSMELAGAFRLGGDVDDAYDTGIEVILAGVSERASPASA